MRISIYCIVFVVLYLLYCIYFKFIENVLTPAAFGSDEDGGAPPVCADGGCAVCTCGACPLI
jgi:hypothetical protein